MFLQISERFSYREVRISQRYGGQEHRGIRVTARDPGEPPTLDYRDTDIFIDDLPRRY